VLSPEELQEILRENSAQWMEYQAVTKNVYLIIRYKDATCPHTTLNHK
jgi:hypothetical protein